MMIQKYLAPEIEIVTVTVEQGFAGSGKDENGGGMSTPTVGGF